MDKLIKYKIMQRVELVGGVPKWVTIDYYLTEKAAREAFWAAVAQDPHMAIVKITEEKIA